ncbi:MAG: hypothetical protein DSM107014_08800 [Gomphosphaeria aponina SAG 52.96 = DSM 107014]|uniref:Uncharacterized protein n=1 Tax=Gomphosphaeria aponina SAG 52.96 = DSM 107014 TaxID=1521640 RepID=A0A941JPS2_9CHRO|nr:hypothetical protein [Gomphosphaeria aponina SAG 52.96 = DSM 107014]
MLKLIAILSEKDYYLWVKNNTKLIQWNYLVSELGDLGKSAQFDAPESRKISWYNSGGEQRRRVILALEKLSNPI